MVWRHMEGAGAGAVGVTDGRTGNLLSWCAAFFCSVRTHSASIVTRLLPDDEELLCDRAAFDLAIPMERRATERMQFIVDA